MKSRTKYVAACAVVCLSLAGCANDETSEQPTPQQLSEALLAISDLEGNWSESQRQAFDTREPENPSIDPSIWCPEATDATKDLIDLAGEAGADVEMESLTGSDRPRLIRLQAWANDDVRDYYDAASTAARLCDGVTRNDENGVTATTELIEGRDVGDESISWSETLLSPARTGQETTQVVSRITIARFGDIIMVLQLGDIGALGSTDLMSEDDWWSIVETASKKLDDLN
jgi:hypothetical protein